MNDKTATPSSSFYPLFKHMSEEHGLTLLDSELLDICSVVNTMRTPRTDAAAGPSSLLVDRELCERLECELTQWREVAGRLEKELRYWVPNYFCKMNVPDEAVRALQAYDALAKLSEKP